MFVVVDTNIVFSALYSKGKPLEVFIVNKVVGLFEFISPEFLFFEIGKRMDKLLSKKKALPDKIITPSEAMEILLGRRAM